MVLNDEGHHAYRPKPTEEKLSADEKKEREEATVWVSGLDTFNQACGVKFCVDLSATPFYIQGSGHPEGTPFPWLVSDFGLVDAIESGITKIPRLPVSDTTGRPEPKFFRLWKTINDDLSAADTSPGRRRSTPKPEAIYREAEAALITLASQWKERFEYIQEASDAQEKTPPVLIVVCADTKIAEYFYQKISGESETEVVDDSSTSGRRKKKQTKTVYEQGAIFPGLLSNTESVKRTLRIDSKSWRKRRAKIIIKTGVKPPRTYDKSSPQSENAVNPANRSDVSSLLLCLTKGGTQITSHISSDCAPLPASCSVNRSSDAGCAA